MSKTKEIVEVEIPDVNDSFFNVVMYNDDVTPFDYVIMVLHTIFGYDPGEGFQIALHIHQNGQAIVATLSMADAYEKVDAVNAENERYGMLLQTVVEKA